MESIEAFIDRLPKVELHLHLVGSASVPTVLELARRHPEGPGGPVPRSAAEATLEHALSRPPEALTGFGLAGIEQARPAHAEAFRSVFASAIAAGLHSVPHAGDRQVPALDAHPLPRLLAEGLVVTLNSDDPPMFGTTLTEEYRRAASVLGLERSRLAELAVNGVRASFLDTSAKRELEAEIFTVASGSGAGASDWDAVSRGLER